MNGIVENITQAPGMPRGIQQCMKSARWMLTWQTPLSLPTRTPMRNAYSLGPICLEVGLLQTDGLMKWSCERLLKPSLASMALPLNTVDEIHHHNMQYAILGFTVHVDILFIRRQGISQIS
jgi:hypothetical protein